MRVVITSANVTQSLRWSRMEHQLTLVHQTSGSRSCSISAAKFPPPRLWEELTDLPRLCHLGQHNSNNPPMPVEPPNSLTLNASSNCLFNSSTLSRKSIALSSAIWRDLSAASRAAMAAEDISSLERTSSFASSTTRLISVICCLSKEICIQSNHHITWPLIQYTEQVAFIAS